MASIKYLLQSKSDNSPIYIRLTLGRNKDYKRKTGLSINPRDWSKEKRLPKQNRAELKYLTSELKSLEKFIYDELNSSNVNGELINGKWLEYTINKHFNKESLDQLNEFVSYGEEYIKNLKYKVTDRGKNGVSTSTKKKYRTIVNKVISYENYTKEKLFLKDVDLVFRKKFIDFLSEKELLNENTIGRYLKFLKTICLDAKKNGFEVSNQIDFFKGYTVKVPKITLSFDELKKIEETDLENENHIITRDWLIIGCYTGQRVSDLLRMNNSMIKEIQGFDFICLEQVKTNKLVQIPIHKEVKKILIKYSNNFPPVFSKNIDSNKAMFNKYLKQVCKLSNINQLVEGSKFDKELKKYIKGKYEKHELVSSHICRRSFATNFYSDEKYPTPLLMNITAHSTERMFLDYIGKKPIDYSLQLAKIWSNN